MKTTGLPQPQESSRFLSPTVTPQEHHIYMRTQLLDSDPIKDAITSHYGARGDVWIKSKLDAEMNLLEEDFTVWFRDAQSKSKLVGFEIDRWEWVNAIIKPELEHFWGQGSVVYMHMESGACEFLYERSAPDILSFDLNTAKRALEQLRKVNKNMEFVSKESKEDGTFHWLRHRQFKLLIYSLLKHGTEGNLYLLSFPRFTDDRRELELNQHLIRAAVYCYMANTSEDYCEDHARDRARQTSFDTLFAEHALDLDLTTSQRIDALRVMLKNGQNELIERAVAALHDGDSCRAKSEET